MSSSRSPATVSTRKVTNHGASTGTGTPAAASTAAPTAATAPAAWTATAPAGCRRHTTR